MTHCFDTDEMIRRWAAKGMVPPPLSTTLRPSSTFLPLPPPPVTHPPVQFGMFKFDEDSHLCWFNPASLESSSEFYLVGVTLGLAIYNSVTLDVPLPLARPSLSAHLSIADAGWT
jgi:hypothetical protein